MGHRRWQLAGGAILIVVLGWLLASTLTREPDRWPEGVPGPRDTVAAESGPAEDCDRIAKPGDEVEELLESLTPGEVVCFGAGTHAFDAATIETPEVTLRPVAGEAATLRGSLRVNPDGRGTVIENLTLDGRSSVTNHGPKIYASDVVLRRNAITNHNTGICVQVPRYEDDPPASDVVIEGNRIHNCGELPATNHHHGIYIQDGVRTVVRGNWFYDNADRGIQQYPRATDSLITGNVIDGNGQGLNFSCDETSCSKRNVVEGNVISNSTIRWNVYANSGGATPDGSNVLRDNCVWATLEEYTDNGGIQSNSDFFSESGNLIAEPAYVDRTAKDFRLRADSPCRAVLDG